MKNTAQQSQFHKQIGLWLVAIAVILTAAFLRGKVNVRAAESLITKHTYINDQKDIWQLKDTKAGQTYKLKIEVGSAYSNPQLKYEWYYIPESNYTAEQKLSCTTSEISVIKSKYREDTIPCHPRRSADCRTDRKMVPEKEIIAPSYKRE